MLDRSMDGDQLEVKGQGERVRHLQELIRGRDVASFDGILDGGSHPSFPCLSLYVQ